MNISITNSLELGQKLWYIQRKERKVYGPCTLCHNNRYLTITDKEDGEEFKVLCPRCSHKNLKGNESKFITIGVYTKEELVVSSVQCDKDKHITVSLSHCDYMGNIVSTNYSDVPVQNGFDEKVIYHKPKWGNPVIFFTDEGECNRELKRLRAEARQQEKDFLKVFEGDSND